MACCSRGVYAVGCNRFCDDCNVQKWLQFIKFEQRGEELGGTSPITHFDVHFFLLIGRSSRDSNNQKAKIPEVKCVFAGEGGARHVEGKSKEYQRPRTKRRVSKWAELFSQSKKSKVSLKVPELRIRIHLFPVWRMEGFARKTCTTIDWKSTIWEPSAPCKKPLQSVLSLQPPQFSELCWVCDSRTWESRERSSRADDWQEGNAGITSHRTLQVGV